MKAKTAGQPLPFRWAKSEEELIKDIEAAHEAMVKAVANARAAGITVGEDCSARPGTWPDTHWHGFRLLHGEKPRQ